MVKAAIKNSALFLEAMFRASNEAIEVLSLDGTVLYWNEASEKLFGYSAEEMIGESILILASADRLDEIPLLLFKIKNGEYIEPFRLR